MRPLSSRAACGCGQTLVALRWGAKDDQEDTSTKEFEHNNHGEARDDGKYADEHAAMVYAAASAVRKLDESLPEETRTRIPLDSVSFAPEHREKAETVLFFANDFMRTNEEETVHLIRPRTRQMLDELGIAYEIVPPHPPKRPR